MVFVYEGVGLGLELGLGVRLGLGLGMLTEVGLHIMTIIIICS